MSEETSSAKYEIMVLLVPDLGEKGTEDSLNEVRDLIKENGGEIYHEDIWGVRDLAYVIRKQERGYYAVFNFEMDPLKLHELNQPLTLQNEVLRYLVTKTAHNYELKSLEEYEEEAKKEEDELEKKKQEKEAAKDAPRKVVKKEVKKEAPKKEEPKKEVKKEAPKKEEKAEEVEETVEEEAPKEVTKEDAKEAAKKLDEVDEKLKSIIDDPDISL